MKAAELYQNMVAAVCRHTGVGEVDVLESNKEECVDARYILIHFLSQYLTDEDISRVTGLTRQAVNYIRNHFEQKMNKWNKPKATMALRIRNEKSPSGTNFKNRNSASQIR